MHIQVSQKAQGELVASFQKTVWSVCASPSTSLLLHSPVDEVHFHNSSARKTGLLHPLCTLSGRVKAGTHTLYMHVYMLTCTLPCTYLHIRACALGQILTFFACDKINLAEPNFQEYADCQSETLCTHTVFMTVCADKRV